MRNREYSHRDYQSVPFSTVGEGAAELAYARPTQLSGDDRIDFCAIRSPDPPPAVREHSWRPAYTQAPSVGNIALNCFVSPSLRETLSEAVDIRYTTRLCQEFIRHGRQRLVLCEQRIVVLRKAILSPLSTPVEIADFHRLKLRTPGTEPGAV